mgnify:CR=1 FL=1
MVVDPHAALQNSVGETKQQKIADGCPNSPTQHHDSPNDFASDPIPTIQIHCDIVGILGIVPAVVWERAADRMIL